MTDVAVWGDYEVHFDQLLGRGGMGSVYKARQRSLGRWVAVKVLDPSRAPDPRLAQGFLEKFQVEIQALARLQDPRIVTIFQAGENDGRFWFAMELIEGKTVEARLFDEGAFSEAETRRIGAQVARALDAAHRQGIVHRDVKPGNVFLLGDGSVKLADFGLARGPELGRTRITDSNAVACTPEYASPELAEGHPTDHRSDLYALGCILYEMVTERPPFAGGSPMETLVKHAAERPPSPRLLNPEVSPEFESVILRCLEKRPAHRYGDYRDLAAALEPARSEPRGGRFWPAAAAAGVALLGVILTAVFTVEPRNQEPTAQTREPQLRPLSPPTPPENLTAVALSPNVSELRWRPGTGQARYRVERSDDDGRSWAPLQTVLSRTATRARVAAAGPGPSSYRVLATASTGESSPSNLASVRHRPPVPAPGEEETPAGNLDPSSRSIVRAVLSVLDQRHRELQRHAYESSLNDLEALRNVPGHTAHSLAVLERTSKILRSVADVRESFLGRLKAGNRVEIQLVDGRSVSGVLQAVTENELQIRTADSPTEVRAVARKDLSDECAVAGADAASTLFYRSLHGDPAAALDLLARRLKEPDAGRLHDGVPALVLAIALRALDAIRPETVAAAKAVAERMAALEELLPDPFHYALDPRSALDYEIRAAEALGDGKVEEVVLKFDLSRQRPAALRRILEDLEKAASAECLAGSRIVGWTVRPPDPLSEDDADKSLVLDQPQGLRRISRKEPRASRGYVLEYSFQGGARDPSGWVLILSDTSLASHYQLAGNERTLSLLKAPPGGEPGELIGTHGFEGGPRFHKLAVVRLEKVILVFHDGALAFQVGAGAVPALETLIQIGVQVGKLKLRSLKVFNE